MFSKILVPVDGSLTSGEALALAIALARDQKAKLICCYALQDVALINTATYPPIDTTPAIESSRKYANALIDDSVDRAKAAGVDVEGQIIEDDPVPMILKLVDKTHADLIVLGTHGRRGFERALMGSTAEGVLRNANVPVLAIRHKDAKQPA